jgi:hypothetical protein
VAVSVQPSGPGALRVTLTAGTSDLLPTNSLEVLRFGAATNALVEISGQPARPGNFDLALPRDTFQFTFVVRRALAGQATHVPLIVLDRCGDWRTFVGSGPSTF